MSANFILFLSVSPVLLRLFILRNVVIAAAAAAVVATSIEWGKFLMFIHKSDDYDDRD
jgi:hypothetical protein